jgi:hypothetical protein
MGKRGPKPGTTYNDGPTVRHALRVESDKQLVAAQHFNDRLERLLVELDSPIYPTPQIELRLVRRLIQTLEAVQGVVIDGISDYMLEEDRRECARERHDAAIVKISSGSPPTV